MWGTGSAADRGARGAAAAALCCLAVLGAAVTVVLAGGPVGRRWLLALAAPLAVAAGAGVTWAYGRADRQAQDRALADRLAQTERQQREFLADLAHEIATPLSSVAGLALALLDGTTRGPTARTETGRLIAGESARIHRLLEGFRDLSRLDITHSARPSLLDVASVVDDVVRRARPAFVAQGLHLDWVHEPVEVRTDQRLVETVVDNFISNAIRYTPRGGRVRVRVVRSGNSVAICVADTGIGISAEDQQRVFDRMFRADRARSRATGGSGLGLAIARRAVDALGGRIELDSVPGRGSEFRLVLAAAGAERV